MRIKSTPSPRMTTPCRRRHQPTKADPVPPRLATAKCLTMSLRMIILQFMGRPRQFDEASAIGAAAVVFRQRGYAATSIDHLVEATGVHRRSLYGVFGSKHGLFLRVLEGAAAGEPGSAERLDILLVALLELAPTAPRLRERVGVLIRESHTTAEDLGRRLLARAGVPRINHQGVSE